MVMLFESLSYDLVWKSERVPSSGLVFFLLNRMLFLRGLVLVGEELAV